MTLVGAAAVAAAAPNAHAMGTYINFDVVAFSTDGDAVLLHRTQSSSGTAGRSATYLLVTATSKTVETTSFDDTLDPDKATQHVSVAQCEKDAAAFAKKVAAAHIEALVFDAKACKSTRAVVGYDKNLVAVTVPAPTSSERQFLAAPGDGKLLLEMWGENGDSSFPGHVRVFVKSGDGYKLLVDDLRY